MKIKYFLFNAFIFLQLFISALVLADSESHSQQVTLPLECIAVESFNEQLCFISTESPFGPFDDIVFYKINTSGDIVYLSSESNGNTTFGGLGFSEGNKYMWLSWAEEGHPYFEFYLTDDFLDNGSKAHVVDVIGDYYFEQFEKFSDTGEVVYLLSEDFTECCTETDKNSEFIINPLTGNKQILKHIYLSIPKQQ
ncbi:MAG: hypothetical protein KAI17_06300 [Thiotrichaceae bacterium]|nr:hypothetical protein [Thiotrichaceae bacterium]